MSYIPYRDISIQFNDESPPMQTVGYGGEGLATTIHMDCSSVLSIWPDSVFTGYFQRPCDSEPYSCYFDVSANEDGVVDYTIMATDALHAGKARYYVSALYNGVQVAKSPVFDLYFNVSLGDPGPSPAPVQSWEAVLYAGLEQVEKDKAEVETLAAQVSKDADQVSTDKADVDEKADQVASDAKQVAEDKSAVEQMIDSFTTDEAQRQQNEQQRIANESQRELNEQQRIENEQSRNQAEYKRQSDTETAIAKTETASNEAYKAADDARTAVEELGDANAAKQAAEAARDQAQGYAADACNSASESAAQAENAKESADEAEAALEEIQEVVPTIAQEDTAESILDALYQAIGWLQQIAENGMGGNLNGFSFSLGENGEVIISYQNPNDPSDISSSTFPTDTTAQEIATQLSSINSSLLIIAGKTESEV